MSEFEKYITGEMMPEERQLFEMRLQQEPQLKEALQSWQSVHASLMRIGIAEKVAAVDAERQAWLRKRTLRWIITGLLLAGLAGLAVFIFGKKDNSNSGHPETPPEIQQQQPPVDPPAVLPNPADHQVSPPSKPIAQAPKNNRPDTQKPMLRSVNPELDAATNQLIDQLLEMTANNNVIFNQHTYSPATDWGKCLAALQKGQYAEARTAIFRIEKTGDTAAQEARWLLGIALLEEGKTDDALAIFEKISKNAGHIRHKEAVIAVSGLQ